VVHVRLDHPVFRQREAQVQTMPGAIVTGHVLGRPTRDVVDFDHAVVAPSPMIVGCPDRTLDRDES
jgi:hypothetical protein